jgi:tetratricopeptide (TPR) repeat protein
MVYRHRLFPSVKFAPDCQGSQSTGSPPDPDRFCRRAFAWIAALPLAAAAAGVTQQTVVPAPSWQQEYWAQFDQKDWDAAIASAEQLVKAARENKTDTGARLAESLVLLGNAQLGKGNLVAAEAAYTEALKLTENYAGRSSGALVDPLRGLGYTLAAEGKHEQAMPYMDRSLLILRRSAGLFSTAQQGLLRQMAASLTALGYAPDAERHMQYLLRVGEHSYGDDDPRMVALQCSVADWYAELGQMETARQLYREGLAIAERNLGRNHIAIVEPLRGLAQSFMREIQLSQLGIDTRSDKMPGTADPETNDGEPLNPRYMSSEGERALLRAVKVLESAPDGSSPKLIETLVHTGDWFLMKQQPSKALTYYKRAATVTSAAAAQSTTDAGKAATLLSFPSQVYYPTPPLATRNMYRAPHEVVERFVQVEFTVMPDGQVKDERVVDKDASERQVSQTLEAIRSSRYRPKFVDGKPVETTAVGYRQIFRQRKEAE